MPRAAITVRPGRVSDARALARLVNALNVAEGKPPGVHTPGSIRRHGFGRAPLFETLVAERAGEVVGYALFEETYNTDQAAPAVWLHDLYVAPGRRRSGVGRALLAAVAAETVARRAGALWWQVRSANLPARAFYRALGAHDDETRLLELDGAALAALAGTAGRRRVSARGAPSSGRRPRAAGRASSGTARRRSPSPPR